MLNLAKSIWVTDQILTRDECEKVIRVSEQSGFKVAHQYEISGRHNHEVFVELSDIHKILEEKLVKQVNKSKLDYKQILVRKRLEIYRYQSGDYIVAHSDAPVQIDGKIWSNFTLVLYLSDEFMGGKTIFPDLNVEIAPPIGSAILFDQSFLHEASTVENGTKYILRTGLALLNQDKE